MSLIDRYPDILTALVIWREARGESTKARLSVYHTIMNRVLAHDRWKNDEVGVILQPNQFSSMNKFNSQSSKYPNPAAGADWKAFREICEMVDKPGPDPTAGANHFYSGDPDNIDTRPSWASPDKITLRLENFTFYRL